MYDVQVQNVIMELPGLLEPLVGDRMPIIRVSLVCCVCTGVAKMQVLATSTDQLQQLVDTLLGLGMTAQQVLLGC
jgi:hypothetical protein